MDVESRCRKLYYYMYVSEYTEGIKRSTLYFMKITQYIHFWNKFEVSRHWNSWFKHTFLFLILIFFKLGYIARIEYLPQPGVAFFMIPILFKRVQKWETNNIIWTFKITNWKQLDNDVAKKKNENQRKTTALLKQHGKQNS